MAENKKKKASQSDFFEGLPVDAINKVLGIEMDPGSVELSAGARRHAESRHPGDVPLILPHLAGIVRSPLYVGDDHRNPGKIEIVGRIPGQHGGALVAIELEDFDHNGTYNICSMYLITQRKIDKKREDKILKNL